MALNTVITAEQVRQGDKIKVTFEVADMTITRTGVVETIIHDTVLTFHTAQGYSLGPSNTSVIELLDRPKPKSIVPSKNLAIVHYQYTPYKGAPVDARTAVRDADGHWTAYGADGFRMNSFTSDDDFSGYLGSDFASELVVAFGGTK